MTSRYVGPAAEEGNVGEQEGTALRDSSVPGPGSSWRLGPEARCCLSAVPHPLWPPSLLTWRMREA